MLDLQPLGNFADPRPHSLGHSLHRQQQLVLLRLKPCRSRSVFTEAEKFANLVPKLRKRPEIPGEKVFILAHWLLHSISQYDVNRFRNPPRRFFAPMRRETAHHLE
jgi:hypothetical protein